MATLRNSFIAGICACILWACTPAGQPEATPLKAEVEIRGVYGNPRPLWKKGLRLDSLGVNAVFVHSGSISTEMIQQARSEGAQVFAEFATLNGKKYVKDHPEAWAINEQGEQVEAASWFMGVCPTEPGFRAYRQQQLRDLLTRFELDGVWLDYVHWHAQFEEREPILPETCFCEHCLAAFTKAHSLEIPAGSIQEKANWILNTQEDMWRTWRCRVILNWVEELRAIVKEISPNALLGLYHCPWDDQEFEGARRRVLGLDYDMLRASVDVFSPMVYHGRMEREPQWVAENITWFSNRIDVQANSYPKLWPIVQAYDEPEFIPAEDFAEVLQGGLSAQSSGVMMFTTAAIAKDSSKRSVMQNLYRTLSASRSVNPLN